MPRAALHHDFHECRSDRGERARKRLVLRGRVLIALPQRPCARAPVTLKARLGGERTHHASASGRCHIYVLSGWSWIVPNDLGHLAITVALYALLINRLAAITAAIPLRPAPP